MASVSLSSQGVEPQYVNDLIDRPKRLPQYLQGWSPLADVRLVDRYLKQKLHILVRFRRRGTDEDLIALFQRESSGDWSQGIVQCLLKINVTPRIERYWPPKGESRHARPGCEQKPMLVDTVKFMESPENVIPSLVWFETSDDFYNLLISSLYFSVKTGFELIGRRSFRENWEVDSSVGMGYEGARHVIQRAPQVLKDISSDGTDRQGNGCGFGNAIEYLSGLQIALSNEHIRVSGVERLECSVKLLDVLVGPLDLCGDEID